MICCQTASWMLLALTVAAGDGPREELSLNGRWEYRIVEQLTAPPSAGEWRSAAVPGTLHGYDYKSAWFRRRFTVPAAMRNKRLKIRFDGVKYDSRVYLNGCRVGGCYNGYDPFEVDVTGAIRPDGPNELVVGFRDWTATFSPGKVDFSKKPDWQRPRRFVRDKVAAPIGGNYDLYGIWADVTLHAHPEVYVRDLFIKPSVRRGELVVDYTVANESAAGVEVELHAAVEDKGNDALSLPSARLKAPAGKTVNVTVRRPWPKPRLWSHVDPYLYHLRTELSTGDVLRTRFGFREFWVEGHRFYLNGTKINFLASAGWPPREPIDREEIERRWRGYKACGCVAFRTHTQPWRRIHYDVADELGLLIIIEGAMWHDPYAYRYDDPTYWENFATHLKSMIDRDKNRPSVVMWSLENEAYGGGEKKDKDAHDGLARMGRLVKQWDPTRPAYCESDADPGGVFDAIGCHYPHELPGYTCWPNEAYWLKKGETVLAGQGGREFVWQKDKPLYMGEFLWIPTGTPAPQTVFFGDEAYLDPHRRAVMMKAESWKMQILGYRHAEVAGICPWTLGTQLDETDALFRAQKYAYQHVAAFCHDYDRRFHAGEKVVRRVEVFNDVPEPSVLDFSWTLSLGEQVADSGGRQLKLGPAEKEMFDVVIDMPQVQKRTPLVWRLILKRNGRQVFEDSHQYDVFGRSALPAVSARLGLYDPDGATKKLLTEGGLSITSVASMEKLDEDIDVLVIGSGVLEAQEQQVAVIGAGAGRRGSLARFVAAGGRVLVLRQEAYPEGVFDVALSDKQATMTFPLRPSHPALEGIEPDDLKFWRGDHLVTANEPLRPASGAAVAIVVSGRGDGINYAPLLERPSGRGCIVHSQLKLVEKFATEPAAARILANLLGYLADYTPSGRKTALVGGSPQYRDYLTRRGLRFDDLTGKLAEVDLSDYSLVLCRGPLGEMTKLRQFVSGGGNLLLHRVDADTLQKLRGALDLDLELRPYSGPVTRAEGDHPLLEAITREDLYWFGEHVGLSWRSHPRAAEAADGIFIRSLDGKQVQSYEVEDWTLEGQLVERQTSGVRFATNGSASGQIAFAATGVYGIGILARGTPCRGGYPRVEVSVDGKRFGTVELAGDGWRKCAAFGHLQQGRHKISVAFVNDASDPPREDRNLDVDKVLVAGDEAADVTFLADPPALAVVSRGKGRLVVDQIRWDTEERNWRQAARYACSLLTALGGDFTPPVSVTIECERMTPQPDMKHFSVRGNSASLACNGYIAAPIRVAAAGRYTMEVVASGTPAEEVYPAVAVLVDGKKVGQLQLTTGGWRTYSLKVDLKEGTHQLALEFTNDHNTPSGEDRNLLLDKVAFYTK